MKKVRIAIYGAGGAGREAAWLLEECNRYEAQYELVGFIDDDTSLYRNAMGSSVFTLAHAARTFPDTRVIVAVGDPSLREQLVKRVQDAGMSFATLVHPNVVRSTSVKLGVGSVICAGCVLTTDILIGQHVHVNLSSSIGHDVVIGDFSAIGPGVRIAGFVHVGKRVFIGAGAVLINGIPDEPLQVGDDTVIGAGSCVIRSLPAESYVFGNPARPIPRSTSRRQVK